jgi:3-dehydroquinate dehydratase I
LKSWWDTFLNLKGIVLKNTKNRFGARIIGIVTPTNRNDPAAWEVLENCDIAEFRADLWEPDQIISEVQSFREECMQKFGHALETIFTLRLKSDGGAWPNEMAMNREKIWLALGLHKPKAIFEWIDIEVENLPKLSQEMTSALQQRRVKLLASHHNMHTTYSAIDLDSLGHKLLNTGAEGIKLAVTCNQRDQILDLMAFAKKIARLNSHACVLSMGGIGRATRVLAPLLGCPLTYGYLCGGAVAPGQLSVSEMVEFYSAIGEEALGAYPISDLLDWAETRISGDSLAK